MKKHSLTKIIAATILLSSCAFVSLAQTNEQGNASTTKPAAVKQKKPANLSKIVERANQEIDRRVVSLGALAQRIQEMKKINVEAKASLAAKVQDEQTALIALKNKIDADTDIETLKTDVKAIAEQYRIYKLVMPQIQVFAAVDRANTIQAALTDIGTKLQSRISNISAQGVDVSALQKSMDEYNAKLTLAKTQVAAAFEHVSPLVPDNGDQTIAKTNSDTIKQSHTEVKEGNKALVEANVIAKSIVSTLKKAKERGQATSTPEEKPD